MEGRRRNAKRYQTSEVVRVGRLAVITAKARTEVVQVTGLTDPEAEAFVRRKLTSLTEDDYHDNVSDQGSPADIYGIRDKHGCWWIKLVLENGRVIVISCHPPEFDMLLVSGTVLPGEKRK